MKLIRHLCLAVACAASVLAGEAGFVPIFNGKDLSGWEGASPLWSVKDGAIVGQTTPEHQIKTNTFLIWRAGVVDDFEIHFKYRITGGNSGLQYRSTEMTNIGPFVVGGYQADIDAGNTYTGMMYEERGRGLVSQRGQKVTLKEGGKKEVTGSTGDKDELKGAIKNGDWNEYVIKAEGNHLVHHINGKMTVDVTDEDEKNRKQSGILAFQLHVGAPMKMEIKDVELKRLSLGSKKN